MLYPSTDLNAWDKTVMAGAQGTQEQRDELAYFEACRPPKSYIPDGRVMPMTPPSKEELDRHLRRFMPEGKGLERQRKIHREAVREIAALCTRTCPPKIRALTDAPKRRRTTPELVAQVAELHQRGMRPHPISVQLNLSERRVKSIVASLA